MRTLLVWMGAAVVAAGVATAAAPDTIDLSSLDDVIAPQAPRDSVWDEAPLDHVSFTGVGQQRFYVTGMIGESFATLADPVYQVFSGQGGINRSVFTVGGAAGVAFERDDGRLRIEAEGRGRDDVTAHFNVPSIASGNWAAADGWSALFNVWRDFTVSKQVDLYLGGGVGGGGYRYSADVTVAPTSIAGTAQVASFAWQAGGGVIWNISDRVAFDVGYRFFSIDPVDGPIRPIHVGNSASVDSQGRNVGNGLQQQFTASELLFGLRIYEPFRRWR